LAPDYRALKAKLFAKCLSITKERMYNAKSAMENAQKAANEEGKSSAGDKYETTRAMMQIERDNAAKQLEEAIKLNQTLLQININQRTELVQAGSLVVTKQATYFICVSLGQIAIEADTYWVVSPVSPLGQQLLGKKQSESFIFNKQTIQVAEIY